MKRIPLPLFFFCFSLAFHVFYISHTDNWDRSPATDTVDFWKATDKILIGEAWKKSRRELQPVKTEQAQAPELLSSWRTDTRVRSRNWEESEYELSYFPMFSIYLTAMRVFFGDDLLLAHDMLFLRWVSLLLYSGVTVLTFLLARRLFGPATALWAGLFCAVNPNLMFWSHYVLTESLFTFAFFLSLYWLVSGSTPPFNGRKILGACLAFIAACLTRPVLLPFGLPLALWFFVRMKGNTRVLRNFVFLIFGSALLYSLLTGSGKLQGSHRALPWDFALKSFLVHLKNHYLTVEGSGTEEGMERARENFFKAWDASLENKLQLALPALCEKFMKFWHWSILTSKNTFQNSTVIRYYALYYLLAYPGLLVSACFLIARIPRSEKAGLILLWLILLYFTFVYTATLRGGGSANRYRVPIEPGIAILAGFTAARVSARGRLSTEPEIETG